MLPKPTLNVHCSVVRSAAVYCSILQCAAVFCSVHTQYGLQCVAVCCSVLQCVAVCCSVLWRFTQYGLTPAAKADVERVLNLCFRTHFVFDQHFYGCACVRACVHACVRACVRVGVGVLQCAQ